ncbi:hypothetical protein [Planomicrobium okeanokoites]|uniref:hypothetical protein n=1 Tax=Planomicrobium okeanokoites TaxID=244 RepID=UPI0030FC7823
MKLLELKNINSLENFYNNEEINVCIYEYAKNILIKTIEILEEDVIQINIEDDYDSARYKEFTLKWQKEIKICEVDYIETFKLNKERGIVFLNKISK